MSLGVVICWKELTIVNFTEPAAENSDGIFGGEELKKIDLGQTISILANVGVIAGIVFLAVELR